MAGISEDNAQCWNEQLAEKSEGSKQLWNFEDNLSAKGIILQYTSNPETGLFIL